MNKIPTTDKNSLQGIDNRLENCTPKQRTRIAGLLDVGYQIVYETVMGIVLRRNEIEVTVTRNGTTIPIS